MNMLLAVYCRDVYGIFSIGRCRVLSGVCYALEFAKNPVCMLEPVMQISCQSGQTIPVIGVDVPACAYPLGFFSGCSGYGMDTSPKTRLWIRCRFVSEQNLFYRLFQMTDPIWCCSGDLV